jgi:hypothetical protein
MPKLQKTNACLASLAWQIQSHKEMCGLLCGKGPYRQIDRSVKINRLIDQSESTDRLINQSKSIDRSISIAPHSKT